MKDSVNNTNNTTDTDASIEWVIIYMYMSNYGNSTLQ